jgi:hypothetical protein
VLAGFPLLEAREVDSSYRYTGSVYALARGDGRLTVRNPYLGTTLILDASDPREPRRSGELDTGKRALQRVESVEQVSASVR